MPLVAGLVCIRASVLPLIGFLRLGSVWEDPVLGRETDDGVVDMVPAMEAEDAVDVCRPPGLRPRPRAFSLLFPDIARNSDMLVILFRCFGGLVLSLTGLFLNSLALFWFNLLLNIYIVSLCCVCILYLIGQKLNRSISLFCFCCRVLLAFDSIRNIIRLVRILNLLCPSLYLVSMSRGF